MSTKQVAIIATDYFEESELTDPYKALADAGHKIDIIAPEPGTIKGMQHIEPGEEIDVDKLLESVDPEDYDAVVLPGGAINADNLRINNKAQQFVQNMIQAGKPVAAICHAPWILVSAQLVSGKHLTSFPTIQDDIRNAGGIWSDEELVVDDNLITSRQPDDLPAFNAALLKMLEQ